MLKKVKPRLMLLECAGLIGTASGFQSGSAGSLQILSWPRPQPDPTPPTPQQQQRPQLQQLQVHSRHTYCDLCEYHRQVLVQS